MKPLLPAALVLVLSSSTGLVGSASGPAQQGSQQGENPAQGSLEERVAALENELAAEKRRHEETRAMLEKTLAYLEQQSQAAQKLMTTLDEVEQQGFAVGENWRSRETLLAGFRSYWGAKATNLPPVPKPAPVQKAPVSQRPARK